LKQTTLAKWLKKPTESLPSPKSPLKASSIRIVLDVNSALEDYLNFIAKIEGNKITLYIKQKQIPLFVSKLSKDQFKTLCNLGDDLSPLKIRQIIPTLDESMSLYLCQFLLGKRMKKIQAEKLQIFSE